MSKITWQYIAGFFDGEGTVYYKQKKNGKYETYTCCCSITQAEFQGQVIYDIQEFLEKERVRTYLYRQPPKGKKNAMLRLYINAYGEMERFLKKIHPFLIVKREKAEEAIKFCSDKMKKKPNLTLMEEDKIMKLNSDGRDVLYIARKVDRHYETIRDFLKRKSLKRNYKIKK